MESSLENVLGLTLKTLGHLFIDLADWITSAEAVPSSERKQGFAPAAPSPAPLVHKLTSHLALQDTAREISHHIDALRDAEREARFASAATAREEASVRAARAREDLLDEAKEMAAQAYSAREVAREAAYSARRDLAEQRFVEASADAREHERLLHDCKCSRRRRYSPPLFSATLTSA